MPSKLLCGRGNCSEVGHHSCSRCHKISYCSELCQKRHWKRHKKDCKSRTKKKICANVLCTKSAHLYCSRCRKISYCSDYCQKKNWKSHRKVCKLSLKHRRRCQSGDCDRNAQLLCSECQLIAYCSDECQKNHLTVHALECGNFETQDICSNCFSSANADFTCDACRSVHYCSSECQIMHAAMGHKDLCVPYVKANVCGNYECDKPAHLACSRCSGIHYCSEVCQRSHWKVHKSECLPEISLTRCNNIDCDKPAHLHCSRCNKMNYCSIECQTSHWIFHKDKCSSLEMIEKKLNPIHRCEYDNCNKSSKSICSRCRKVYYCSEKCQRKHFKTHRRFCVSATDVVTVDRDEPEFVRKRLDKGEEQLNIMVNYLRKSGLSNLPVLEDEYQSIYPLDIDGYNIVKVIARRAELLDVEERGTIELRDPITQQDTAFRWGKLCEELELFLSNKPRLGDIYLAPYETELQFEHNWQYQKCPSYAMPRLFSGQTVIDIGCVDFGILLYSDIHGCEEMKEMKVIDNDNGNNNASEGKNANDDANGDDVNPLRFYGYGGNVFSVCKTRVLVHMLQDRDVSIQSIVEIFVSSLWSEKTLKDFERAIRSLFEQKQEPLVSSLLQHWILELRYPLSKHKAIETWRAKCRRLDTIDAYNFKFRADRVLLTNYVLTGALYDGVHGSIVMFNNPKYIQDHMPFFSALSALPNSFWFSLEEQQIDLKPITDLVKDHFYSRLRKLRGYFLAKELIFELSTESVSNENLSFLVNLRHIKPDIVCWNDIVDYISPKSFHEAAAFLSSSNGAVFNASGNGQATIHHVNFRRWSNRVFGAHFIDYNHHKLVEFIIHGTNELIGIHKKMGSRMKDYPVCAYRDKCALSLAPRFVDKFKTWFFHNTNIDMISKELCPPVPFCDSFNSAYISFSYVNTPKLKPKQTQT